MGVFPACLFSVGKGREPGKFVVQGGWFMAEAKTAVANKPVWVDLASSDPAAARDFYSKLFGWKVEVNPDPQYGGYGLGQIGGKDVAGIGGKQKAEAPTPGAGVIGGPRPAGKGKKGEAAGGPGG